MDFLQHTLNWTKGEIFESVIISIAGVLLIAAAILFLKYGTTSGAKAIVIPLLLVGTIFTLAGVFQTVSNTKRIKQFENSYQKTPTAFVLQEKERVEQFQPIYIQVRVAVTVCFFLTMFFVWFTENQHLYGAAIGLVLLGVSALCIDYFSKERADHYYEMILVEMGQVQS